MLKILLIGKGGREHALAWRLSQSQRVEHIYVVPGNGGTSRGLPKVSNLDTVKADNYPALIQEAKRLDIGLVVAGTDQAVVDGIEGFCSDAGIPCFAPSKSAAEIEGSKAWAKSFMERQDVPTAAYASFTSHQSATAYLKTLKKYPVVIKASGLAAGKGVIIAQNPPEAEAALQDFMVDSKFGDAGAEVVIEEFLTGPEISIHTITDGTATTCTLPSAQDHKAIHDGDKGPNTGGMGVVSPVPATTPWIMSRIKQEILIPTFEGLRVEGREYRGMLFTGCILTADGPKVLEFNARFGDPETQSLMLLLSPETDLAEVLMACATRRLKEVEIGIREGVAACNVVVVAGGYPGSFEQGDVVTVDEDKMPEDTILFHAGTALREDQDGKSRLVTAGGRVFSVAATGPSLEIAVQRAYAGVECVEFRNKQYRKDIGRRFLQ